MDNPTNFINRLNWIDWAKVIAITLVVYGHVPQERGSFGVNYVVQFHMPLFFFISGYLTKKESFGKATMKKYCRTLIIPYFIYNLIFYPFWLVRYFYEHSNPIISDLIKPIIGTFLLQQVTTISLPLYGVTWFIAALFLMKLFLSVSHLYRHGHLAIFFLSLACAIAYVYNEFYRIVIDLTPVGIMKCLPFFILGYYAKIKGHLPTKRISNDFMMGFCCMTLSIIVYFFLREHRDLSTYGFFIWTICLSAICGIFCICRLLDNIHNKIIVNISIGTIVIMGLHGMVITMSNFLFAKLLGIGKGITYPWYIAILLSLAFIIVLYPLIIFFKNKVPFMLGKSNSSL